MSPTIVPGEIGSLDLTITTADGADVPTGTRVCIAGQCQTIGAIASLQPVAAAFVSGDTITFGGIRAGMQTLTITGAAGYQNTSENVIITPGTTVAEIVTLQLAVGPTVSPTTPTAATTTPLVPATAGATTPQAPNATPAPVNSLPNTGSGSTSDMGMSILLLLAAMMIALAALAISRRRRA